jgi:TatD DNase family protein
MSRHRSNLLNGCVHSFTGDMDEMRACVDMGMYIGLNGCSLKTQENLDVVQAIPANRILLETDAPWCDIRPTHAGYKHVKTQVPIKKKEKWSDDSTVRGRNEPCNMVQVAEVVAAVRNMTVEELSKQVFDNTKELYFPNDQSIQYVSM